MTASSPTIDTKITDLDELRRRVVASQPVDLSVVTGDSTVTAETLIRDLAPAFMEWQCRMIAGVMRGVIYLADANNAIDTECARWPASGQAFAVLQDCAEKALATKASQLTPQVHYSDHQGQVCDVLACPIIYNGRAVAVVSVALATRALPQQKAVLQLVEWGINWFQTLIRRESENMRQRAPFLLQLLSHSMGQRGHTELAHAAVELIAKRPDCERASIAIVSGGRLKLLAVSGLTQFDQRTRFATRIEDAMEEADDQGVAISYPTAIPDNTVIRRAHQRLVDANPNSCFFTVVAQHGGTRLGLLIESDIKKPSDSGEQKLYQEAVQLLAQSADLNRTANSSVRSLLSRGQRGVAGRTRGRFGVWLLVLAACIGAAAIIPSEHRITADAELASLEQRAVVASINGYIETVNFRAGDDVQTGDLLATLDTRDLRLEADKWRSLLGARQAEYQDALANRDRIQISVLRARLDQIEAELALVNAQIARAELRAPYPGVVVSGDLNQILDAPIEKGQVLFEIAPLKNYRVVIRVSEYDISAVKEGYKGKLRLTSLPDTLIPFTIERILPVAASGDGRTYFQVEARLSDFPAEIRPGMHGVAKIIAEERSLLWRWTHELNARIKLFVWSLGF